MQTTSNATLFQTSHSEALGAYRARKAVLTSGLVSSASSADARARYGHPIHLNPSFESAVVANAADLAVEGSGADGGRFRVLSLRVADGCVWTSEAGGVVRQVEMKSGCTVAVYRGAKAPVPSFDFLDAEGGRLLVTGSWDRAIRVYRIPQETGQAGRNVDPIVVVENAMVDFIKAIHVFVAGAKTYIATAGSDKSVMLWDATPLLSPSAGTLKCVHQSKHHSRPINALASLVGLDGITRLYSADSMGRVLECSLHPSTQRLEVLREITGFSTSVYDLKVGWRREEVEGDTASLGSDAFVSEVKEDLDGSRYRLVAELWGASGDKSAAGYRLSPALQPVASVKAGGSTSTPLLGTQDAVTTPYVKVMHEDFVKAVLPLSLYLPPAAQFEQYAGAVVTGGSDEHVRVYPSPTASTTLSAAREEGEVHEVEAHWHEITTLALWLRPPSTSKSDLPPIQGEAEAWIVSASLDGSVRRWPLHQVASLPKPEMVRPTIDAKTHGGEEWDQNSLPPVAPRKKGEEEPLGAPQMTAEEEAELAELMGSDEE
ncbi:WD40 repeat [Kalmanozyma brasiliensis GHG001]|uniref:WD40 repeat-like protein n=1 Tax=Kalmanozyma brasiliensis (strain GHG001) TaxID=1365824 RepID=V5EB33_KALBG|nr:WD40 repeat [Kalmanozyma brasiliensis GHG001]EST07591.1 WD40 repeat [Kalmanozyma brasiliensis GHG001]